MADLEALRPRLLKYAGHRADPAAAEDIVQNAILRAGWAPDAPNARYFAAVTHAAIDWWRHERRHPRLPLSPALPAAQADPAVGEALAATLARLAGEPHGALLLAFAQGTPLAELAAREGVALGTIKTRIWRTRRALGPCPLDD